MRIETAIIKCEFCDFVFDLKKYKEEMEKIVKPYAEESVKIFHLYYNDHDKQIEKLIALNKKYNKQFGTVSQMFKPDTYQKDDNYFANFICKKCNKFSANLYNFMNRIDQRLLRLRKKGKDEEGICLVYFGVVFDSKKQIYTLPKRKNLQKLDYISYVQIHRDNWLSSKNYSVEDRILYDFHETFSFDYSNLTFIFSGKFTDNIEVFLTDNTIFFVKNLISLDIVDIKKFSSDLCFNQDLEKFTSYIKILENLFVQTFFWKMKWKNDFKDILAKIFSYM